MARNRASMREGPLAELFRATEAAQQQSKGGDAQQQLPTEPEQPPRRSRPRSRRSQPTPIRAVAPAPDPEPEPSRRAPRTAARALARPASRAARAARARA